MNEIRVNTQNGYAQPPRMRSPAESARITGISEYAIRQMVKQNKISYINCGRRILINLDKLIGFLNGEGA